VTVLRDASSPHAAAEPCATRLSIRQTQPLARRNVSRLLYGQAADRTEPPSRTCGRQGLRHHPGRPWRDAALNPQGRAIEQLSPVRRYAPPRGVHQAHPQPVGNGETLARDEPSPTAVVNWCGGAHPNLRFTQLRGRLAATGLAHATERRFGAMCSHLYPQIRDSLSGRLAPPA